MEKTKGKSLRQAITALQKGIGDPCFRWRREPALKMTITCQLPDKIWVKIWRIDFNWTVGHFEHWCEGGRSIHVPLLLECLLFETREAGAHHRLHSLFKPYPPSSCNHVSSYIITFQLLTGVWPALNISNLIHVFPKTHRGALSGRCWKKVQNNMLCHVAIYRFSLRGQRLFIVYRNELDIKGSAKTSTNNTIRHRNLMK